MFTAFGNFRKPRRLSNQSSTFVTREATLGAAAVCQPTCSWASRRLVMFGGRKSLWKPMRGRRSILAMASNRRHPRRTWLPWRSMLKCRAARAWRRAVCTLKSPLWLFHLQCYTEEMGLHRLVQEGPCLSTCDRSVSPRRQTGRRPLGHRPLGHRPHGQHPIGHRSAARRRAVPCQRRRHRSHFLSGLPCTRRESLTLRPSSWMHVSFYPTLSPRMAGLASYPLRRTVIYPASRGSPCPSLSRTPHGR